MSKRKLIPAMDALEEILADHDSGESDFEMELSSGDEEDLPHVDRGRVVDMESPSRNVTEPPRKVWLGDNGSRPCSSDQPPEDDDEDDVALAQLINRRPLTRPATDDEDGDDDEDNIVLARLIDQRRTANQPDNHDDDGADRENNGSGIDDDEDDDDDDEVNNQDGQQPRHWVPAPNQPQVQRWRDIERGAYRDPLWLRAFDEQCGVLRHNPEATPQEIFGSLLPEEAIDLMVRETNRYAAQYFAQKGGINALPQYSPARKWKDVGREDIRAFVGITLLMGLVRLPSYKMYWSNCWLLDMGMKSVISRDRFLLIMRFLHCADNTLAVPRNDANYDRLHKIRGLVDIAVHSWQEEFYPSREISGDETIIPFKGTTSMKGYNPQKPHKWGLTVWSLADSKTGYVYNWNIYEGKGAVDPRTQNNDGRGKVHWITWDLLESANMLGKNHHFYCDNYFSSPTLFEDLATRQTGACGTLRRNRTGTPDAIKSAKPKKTDPAVVAKSGENTFFSWQDRNLVNCITTIHTEETFMKRTRSKNSPTGWQEREKPKAIECYTKYMRGVDLADQAMWYTMGLHKSVKWWKKIFVALLEVCMCNALVIYRSLNPGKNVDRNRFRLHVISHLTGGYSNRGPQRGPVAQNAQALGQLARALQLRFQPGPHFPVVNPERTPKGNQSKPRCTVCATPDKRVQTIYMCGVCRVPLCPAPCMMRFHTIEVSWRKPRAEMVESDDE